MAEFFYYFSTLTEKGPPPASRAPVVNRRKSYAPFCALSNTKPMSDNNHISDFAVYAHVADFRTVSGFTDAFWHPKFSQLYDSLTGTEQLSLLDVVALYGWGERRMYVRGLTLGVAGRLEEHFSRYPDEPLEYDTCFVFAIEVNEVLEELGVGAERPRYDKFLDVEVQNGINVHGEEHMLSTANSLNDKWESELMRRFYRSKLKREYKRAKKLSLIKENSLIIEEFELPCYEPPSATKAHTPATYADWVRKGLKRAQRKLKRYTRWLFRLEQKADDAFATSCSDAADFWRVELQAGAKVADRATRDQQQREAAQRRTKQAYKAIPKTVRKKTILSQRDKRNPVLQSGKVLPALAGAGVVLALNKFRSIFNKTEKVIDNVQVILDKMRDLAESMKKHLGKALWYIPIVMTVFFSLKHFTGASPLLAAAIVAALAKLLGPKVWDLISKFFPEGDVGLQSGGFGTFVEVAPKLLATLFTFAVLGNRRPASVSEFCKRIAMLDRMSQGWEIFLKWLMTSLEVLVNYVRKAFGKERVTLFRNAHTPTYDWAREVDDVCLIEATGGNVSAEHLDRMSALIVRGFEFKTVYRGTNMARFVDDYVAKITNAMLPYQGALNARNNFRFEPATLMLHGSPGIGKTLMAMHMCAAILLESGLAEGKENFEDVIKQIWQKGASEYWNGYAGQTCLVMDDAFQKRASQNDEENDYMSLIRMVSSWSFPLNFADLASKGKIYFSSKFIYATTNLRSIDSEAKIVIQEPEAVARRLNFPYSLRVKEAYRNGSRLDFYKFQAELSRCRGAKVPIEAFPWYVWEAAKHDFITGETSNEWVPLREVIDLVSGDLRKRGESHTVAKDALRDFIDAYKARPQEEPEKQAGAKLSAKEPYEDDEPEEGVIMSEASAEAIDRILAGGRVSDILGVDVDASEAAINLAYKKLSVLVHPDKCSGSLRAAKAMKKLNSILDRVLDARAERVRFNAELKKNLFEMINFQRLIGIAFDVTMTAIGTALVLRAVRGVLAFLWDVLKALFGKKKKQPKDEPTVQSNRPHTGQSKGPRKPDVFLQSTNSTVCNNVYANTYKMYVATNDEETVLGQVVFLVSELIVCPGHFTQHLRKMLENGDTQPHFKLYFRSADNNEHVLSMTVGKYMALNRCSEEGTDVEFVCFQDVRAHRNITGSFMKEQDLRYVENFRARLDLCEITKTRQLAYTSTRRVFELDAVSLGKNLKAEGVKISRFAQYHACTEKGDCGAPLCIVDNSSFSGRTAYGIHVAGSARDKTGFSAIVTQEMIEKARIALRVVNDSFLSDLESRGVKLHCAGQLPFEKHGSFLSIGVLEKPVTICPKTSFYQTSLYGIFGEYDYRPAHMSSVMIDGKKVYPMENAVAPYSTPLLIYEQPWLEQAMHVAMKQFSSHSRPLPRMEFTFEEAIAGIPEIKFRSIPRGTAAGFPYIYDVRNGKKEFFGAEGEYELTSDKALELRARVEYILSEARKGNRLSHIFVDFLKDELRSAKKVDAVATRLISSAPLDYTVAWRMLFGAFGSAVMRTHTKTGMSPGICVYTDWDLLATQLRKKGDRVFDGDFKSFDSSEQPTVHRLILSFINGWYNDGPENALAREVLWLDLVHSRHVGGLGKDQRYVYQWNKSLPSGHPFTTIVNSMYSLFVLVSSYISLTGDLTGYWEHCSPTVYGDDNGTNVDEETSEVYNQVTVSEDVQEQFGMIYTPGNKSGIFKAFTTLEHIDYLQRGFVCRDNRWLCPLKKESFLYTIYWCKNKKLEKKIAVDVLENALVELSMHTPEDWDLYAPQIKSVLDERGHVTDASLKQDQYLALARKRVDSWF